MACLLSLLTESAAYSGPRQKARQGSNAARGTRTPERRASNETSVVDDGNLYDAVVIGEGKRPLAVLRLSHAGSC
jgi:hypothetical protein